MCYGEIRLRGPNVSTILGSVDWRGERERERERDVLSLLLHLHFDLHNIVIKFGRKCANHKVTSERIPIKNAETSSELTRFNFL
jgi:hypothetical protein